MKQELILLTTHIELDKLINNIDWHCAYIKETHFANTERQSPVNGNTICGPSTLTRILIALPEVDEALEIFSFATEKFEVLANHPLEEEKTGTVKRRVTELDFGAFYLRAGCVGYRRMDISSVQAFNYYSTEELFDQDGELLHPYSVCVFR